MFKLGGIKEEEMVKVRIRGVDVKEEVVMTERVMFTCPKELLDVAIKFIGKKVKVDFKDGRLLSIKK